MPRRWSKLQKRIYNLVDPKVHFQIHCVLYKKKSPLGRDRLPRYFITIGKDIVFDYPKEATLEEKYNSLWSSDVDKISDLIEEYVQRPKERLFDDFPDDRWGITDILRACDRRIGREKLKNLREDTESDRIKFIINRRMEREETPGDASER